jgi:hypothetical protein
MFLAREMMSERAQRRISVILIVIVIVGLVALSMAPGGTFSN